MVQKIRHVNDLNLALVHLTMQILEIEVEIN